MSSSYGPLAGIIKALRQRVLIKFLSVSVIQWLIFFIGVNGD
jgi:hypothetical protein